MAPGTDPEAEELGRFAGRLHDLMGHWLDVGGPDQSSNEPADALPRLTELHTWVGRLGGALRNSGMPLGTVAPETFGVVEAANGAESGRYGARFRDPRGYTEEPTDAESATEREFHDLMDDSRVHPGLRVAAARLVPALHLVSGAGGAVAAERAARRDLGSAGIHHQTFDSERGSRLRGAAANVATRALSGHVTEAMAKLNELAANPSSGSRMRAALANTLEPLIGHLEHVYLATEGLMRSPRTLTAPAPVRAAARTLSEGPAMEGAQGDAGIELATETTTPNVSRIRQALDGPDTPKLGR